MAASEKLQQLIENNKLTDSQLENVNTYGIQWVSDLKNYFIDQLNELQHDNGSIEYEEVVSTLCDLLSYTNEDDFIVYDEQGVYKLDFDTLNDALDVD